MSVSLVSDETLQSRSTLSEAQRFAVEVMRNYPRLTRSHARRALSNYAVTLNAMERRGLVRYLPHYDAWELAEKGREA